MQMKIELFPSWGDGRENEIQFGNAWKGVENCMYTDFPSASGDAVGFAT